MENAARRLLWASACLVVLAPLIHSQLAIGEPCTNLWDHSQGTCRLLSDCPSALAQLQNGTRPTICSFSGLDSVVCCKSTRPADNTFGRSPSYSNSPTRPAGNTFGRPPSYSTSPTRPADNTFGRPPSHSTSLGSAAIRTTQNYEETSKKGAPNADATNAGFSPAFDSSNSRRPQSSQGGKRVSERRCEEYKKLVTTEVQALPMIPDIGLVRVIVPTCQRYPTNDAGRYQGHPEEFPHTVAVGHNTEGGIQWTCAGTLISNRFVVTSAQCTYSQELRTQASICRIGGTSLLRRESSALDVSVARVLLHPDYWSTWYNDIALLQLERSVSFSASIRPACLWQRDDFDGSMATTAGWKNITYSNPRSDVLMRAQLQILDQASCRAKVRPTEKTPRGVTNQQLCAENVDREACTGQSGGPLTVTAKDVPCMFQLVGVTSLASECGSHQPGVYTRISSYLPWIESQVWPDD